MPAGRASSPRRRPATDAEVGELLTWPTRIRGLPADGNVWRVRRKVNYLGITHLELQNVDTLQTKTLSATALDRTYRAHVADPSGIRRPGPANPA